MIWKIIFFPPQGERHSPFDFISSKRSTTAREKAQIAHRTGIIQEREPNECPSSWIHQIDGKIYQLSAGQIRLMFFRDGRTIVFVNAFRKKTNKTPRREINRAWEHHDRFMQDRER